MPHPFEHNRRNSRAVQKIHGGAVLRVVCHNCGIGLPNRWAVGKTETVDGAERRYCRLCANVDFEKKADAKKEKEKKEDAMTENRDVADADREKALVQSASGELARKAWAECSSLAARLGGGVKTLWAKINPDRSPEAMLAALDGDLAGNRNRLDAMKPQLDGIYRDIVAKKKEYQGAAPARQRLLKIELQTLMARYKSLEREFSILNENERSMEIVRGRFLEVVAYGLRGKLNVEMVDRLTDDIDSRAEDAEDIQEALGDLERAGRRTERSLDDFDLELADFDGELGLAGDLNNKEKNNETEEAEIGDGGVRNADAFAESDGCLA